MIRFISLTAIGLAFLAATGLGAEPAFAGGYHHGKHHHGHYDGHAGYHYSRVPFVYELGRAIGAFLPHRRPYYRYDGYSDRYHAPPRAYPRRGARYHQYSRRGSNCHAVSKTEYHHGRLARIAGTMCYDRYGNPYVVAGSRYVMHYYD